ncbi:MAG: DUF4411 family protein [Deltaproteobacteria bacterium]|nr:DUF4411 family protein [Deltaproteobacteria bacterium]MBN2673057.1 DUF4411 family protein [Deltaproteobacteria bacterium]
MNKKYCLDTSGLSNPLETMPEDIYKRLWEQITERIESGIFAVTTEIYEELERLPGRIGQTIKDNKSNLVMEVGAKDWDWPKYVAHSRNLNITYHDFISEYSGGSPRTICLNDMTLVALAGALSLPVISMEGRASNSPNKRRIPDICISENIGHLTFNDFLRRENITV